MDALEVKLKQLIILAVFAQIGRVDLLIDTTRHIDAEHWRMTATLFVWHRLWPILLEELGSLNERRLSVRQLSCDGTRFLNAFLELDVGARGSLEKLVHRFHYGWSWLGEDGLLLQQAQFNERLVRRLFLIGTHQRTFWFLDQLGQDYLLTFSCVRALLDYGWRLLLLLSGLQALIVDWKILREHQRLLV